MNTHHDPQLQALLAEADELLLLRDSADFIDRHTDAADLIQRLADHIRSTPSPAGAGVTGGLLPETTNLVDRFAVALKEKLLKAQQKYGYADSWKQTDWESDCRAKLYHHMAKGDPRDVAAYCAFMWHHGWSTERPPPKIDYEREEAAYPTPQPAPAMEDEAVAWNPRKDTHEPPEWESPQMDEWQSAIEWTTLQLAAMLGVKDYNADAATETLEGDTRAIMWNVLKAAGVVDEETGELYVRPAAPQLSPDWKAALERIAALNPDKDSAEGFNEWGEADCFRLAQGIAEKALAAPPPPASQQTGESKAADDFLLHGHQKFDQ